VRKALHALVLLACHETPAIPSQRAMAPAEGAVAVAGSVRIEPDLVAKVAAARGEPPRSALEALLFDAVLAQGALEEHLDRRAEVREAERSMRARLVTDRLAREAEAKGPPTDEEVAAATERHWRDVDLPEQARAVHVVVMADKDPGKAARAHAVAEQLHKAVLGATSEADFLARAKEVDPEGLQVRPESLPTFAADGRIVDADGTFDMAFTRAAFSLAPGQTSGVVETQFGLHVIRMLERLPAKQLPLEERRTRFRSEIFAYRGHTAYVSLLDTLKRRHPIVVDPSADTLMTSAQTAISPPR
jgi:peptidyl-prolyl cis-trans isomerase C